jgi:tetratricopeptide (TPR) repeat protein
MMQEYAQLNETYEQVFGETIESRYQKQPERQGPDISERKLKYEQSSRITESPSASRQQPTKKDTTEQSTAQASAEARAVLSKHKTFASYTQDKFNQSLKAAERYMKQGKFYLAVDAYTLASMYKPDDPLVYAGRSHALFAAGEYVSSALYLAKAIEMFPAYVDFEIDIVSMIGDADTVEKRIADINRWLEASKSPELNFLLAYIYMQLDRLPKAKEEIAQAYQKMPDVTAVAILREAIQKRTDK